MRNGRVRAGAAIRESLGNALRFLTWDLSALLFLELICKMILLAVLAPLGGIIVSRALKEAGLILVSEQNVMTLFSNGISLALIVLWLFLLAFAVYAEICAVLLYFESARLGRKTAALTLLVQGVKRALCLFHRKKAAIIPFLPVLIPLMGFGISLGPLRALGIPEYIRAYIGGNPALAAGSILLFAAVCAFVFVRMFSLPEIVLEDGSVRDACRRSRLLIKGRTLRTLSFLFVWWLLCSAAALCASLIMSLVLYAWAHIFYSGETAVYAFWFASSRLWNIIGILASIYVMVCSLSIVTALYYQYHGGKPACVRPVFPNRPRSMTPPPMRRWSPTVRILLLFLLFLLCAETAVLNTQNWLPSPRTQIVAHRGGALFAPENTLAAIRKADTSGAEYAEIDVRRTKDGELIALHDVSFHRSAGVSRLAGDVTLEEAKGFDVGISFSNNFEGERVPTLEEILRVARGRLGLMIELKGSGSPLSAGAGESMEEETVRLIRKYDMQGTCVVGSMDYAVLQRIKAIDPEVRTVCIMAGAGGDFDKLTAADMFSVEESAVTPQVIRAAHGQGKPVFVWTVNGEKSMRRLIRMGADGLVTDNPFLAGYVRETRAMDRFSQKLAHKL